MVAGWAVVLGVALGSCSSEDDSVTAEASPTGPDLCASADVLRTSLAGLKDVQVVEEGIAALEEAWTPVQDDWATFADAARAQFSEGVDAARAEADAVRDAIDTARDTPSAASLGGTVTTVRAFVEEADALVNEVTPTC